MHAADMARAPRLMLTQFPPLLMLSAERGRSRDLRFPGCWTPVAALQCSANRLRAHIAHAAKSRPEELTARMQQMQSVAASTLTVFWVLLRTEAARYGVQNVSQSMVRTQQAT